MVNGINSKNEHEYSKGVEARSGGGNCNNIKIKYNLKKLNFIEIFILFAFIPSIPNIAIPLLFWVIEDSVFEKGYIGYLIVIGYLLYGVIHFLSISYVIKLLSQSKSEFKHARIANILMVLYKVFTAIFMIFFILILNVSLISMAYSLVPKSINSIIIISLFGLILSIYLFKYFSKHLKHSLSESIERNN